MLPNFAGLRGGEFISCMSKGKEKRVKESVEEGKRRKGRTIGREGKDGVHCSFKE